ncbi:exportin-6 [Octopus bimaculoides]|nr:exportin-6 [Octopus bimaculoides]
MTEFFAVATTNSRKREIEELLNLFSQTQDSWKHCLFYMANTQNEYVIMFCLTVLENVINKQWVGYCGADKMDIRLTLNQYLYAHHNKVPSFIRNKLVKLVVDIGRTDWPHFYPDFFTNILQLVQDSETVTLGVLLLKMTSEELMAPREDLSMARKEELHRLLLAQIPTVLNLLNNILESVLEKHWHLVAATPPPSPTQGDSGTRQRGSSLMLFSSSPLQSDSLLSNMFKSPSSGNRSLQLEALPPLDMSSSLLCELSLECLAHYFTWVPLSNTITPNLLSTIFHFAAFGCEVRSSYHHHHLHHRSGGGSGGGVLITGGGGVNTTGATAGGSGVPGSTATRGERVGGGNNNNSSSRGRSGGGVGGGSATSTSANAASVTGGAIANTPVSASTAAAGAAAACPSNGGGGAGGVAVVAPANTQSLGVLAMNCINELLSKNCVPQEFEDFLLQMFQQTFFLLQRLTKESTLNTSGNKLADLDECYVEKFTDFLRLFVSIHLRRFESNAKFPVLEFLALLFKYTFRQPTNEGFYSCLDIWTVFLDYLHSKSEMRTSDHEEVTNRYKPALQSLVSHILQKLQFRYNQSQLEELDDESLDDDSETEWQHYLRQCLEVIAKVGEILSQETFQLLNDLFQEYTEVYLGLEQYVVPNGAHGRKLTITAENECRRLHCILRDLSSLEQALGRMAEHFIGDRFIKNFTDADNLVQRSLFHCTFSVSPYCRHAQALATLKAFAHWLSQYHSESQKISQPLKFTILFSTLVEATLPLFRKQIPEKIVQSAAHLLLSLMVTVRPSYLLQMTAVHNLYSQIGHGHCKDMPQEVQLLLYRALSHYLLLPWPHLSDADQDWEKRAAYHHDFTRQLTLEFCQLRDTQALVENKALQESAKCLIENTLKMCQDWIENIASESNKSKQICYQSLHEIVQVTLAIFPVYIHQPGITPFTLDFRKTISFLETIPSFPYLVLSTLKKRKRRKREIWLLFLAYPLTTFPHLNFVNFCNISREQLTENILHENSAGCRVVEKFLRILELIVQEPGSAFKAFLPSIISVCMDQIYPVVAQVRKSIPPIIIPGLVCVSELGVEVVLRVATTTFTILPFFVTNVVPLVSCCCYHCQAFGQSFLQPDIALFRQNLESLETLNTKWKLYHKKVFREALLYQFLNVFIQVLLQKSHDLLQEEIAISVYNMASVDFDNFYTQFLPNFLNSCDGLAADQRTVLGQNFKMDKDMPSFTQSVNRFVNDLRYYRLINSSLPAGSFKF